MNRIHVVDKIQWPFDGKPYVTTKSSYQNRQESVDPFPCYTHDVALVKKIVKKVEKCFPIGYKPHYNLMAFESLSRTNGWADSDRDHREKRKQDFHPVITLSGKRIPIHPAMTRYLIAHEYGHIVDRWIEHKLNYEDYQHILRDEYAKMRGIKSSEAYGGGNWATNTGEILANDFRIVVCGLEEEFWPHDVPHPLKLKRVEKWWHAMMEKLS